MPFVTANGVSLHFERWGEGRTALLLSELGGSTRSWLQAGPLIGRHMRALALDIRGTGLSEKPVAAPTMEQIATDCIAAMDVLGIDSFDLVGCAMGSIVALEIARLAPDRIGRIVLCSVSPDIPEKTRRYAGQRADEIRRHGMRAASGSSTVNSFPDGIAQPLDETRIAYEANFLANDPKAYADLTEALLDWQGSESLGSIKCPCLCLAGDLDFMWTEDDVRATAARLPQADTGLVPQAGHFPHQSNPEVFAQAVVAFLSED